AADGLKRSTPHDGGATWGAPVDVGVSAGATGLGGQPVVQPDGDVVVPAASADESAVIAFRPTDGGASWSAPVTVSPINEHTPAANLRADPLPSAEIDGAGRVYVAWHDCRFRPGCATNDIVISASDDGVSWSAP